MVLTILLSAVPLTALALWLWSLYSLRQWRYFLPFFLANVVVLGLYLFATLNGIIGLGGHDEYGLGRIAAALFALLAHIIGVALFTFWYRHHESAAALKANA